MPDHHHHAPTVHFIGGPYDGLRLDDYQLDELTLLVPLQTACGVRVFTLMPPLRRWKSVLSGRRSRDEAMPNYAYELFRTPNGEEFRDAEQDGSFGRALEDRSRG